MQTTPSTEDTRYAEDNVVLPLIPKCLGQQHGLQYDSLTCNFVIVQYVEIEKVMYYESIVHDESNNITHML